VNALPASPAFTAAPKGPSKQALRSLSLFEQIAETAPDEREICFAPAPVFTQTALPSRDPGPETPAWIRRNGDATLVVTPGIRALPDGTAQRIGYPFGTTPRLALIYIATEAIRTRRPEIEFGRSLAEFLRRIGLASHSYHYRAVPEQLVRLLSANIRFTFTDNAHLEVMSNRSVADDYVLWWDAAKPEQNSLWRSYVVLHHRFFRDVLDRGFPLDLDAVRALHQSALALDLYTWLAYRTQSLKRDVRVPWRALHSQLGSSYADLGDFRARVKRTLTVVSAAHRGFRFDFYTGGMVLKPSLPPILPRPKW